MGLGIYSVASPSSSPASISGQLLNPIVVAADGRSGAVVQRKLWVRNDSPGFHYSGISIEPVDLIGTSVVNGAGFSIKISAGDTQPTESAWGIILAGSRANLSGVILGTGGEVAIFSPFWIRVEVPRSTSIRNITDVRLRLRATKSAN